MIVLHEIKGEPLTDAAQIKRARRLAYRYANRAITHAVQCASLLAKKREELGPSFDDWAALNCNFSSDATRAFIGALFRPATDQAACRALLRAAFDYGYVFGVFLDLRELEKVIRKHGQLPTDGANGGDA